MLDQTGAHPIGYGFHYILLSLPPCLVDRHEVLLRFQLNRLIRHIQVQVLDALSQIVYVDRRDAIISGAHNR